MVNVVVVMVVEWRCAGVEGMYEWWIGGRRRRKALADGRSRDQLSDQSHSHSRCTRKKEAHDLIQVEEDGPCVEDGYRVEVYVER